MKNILWILLKKNIKNKKGSFISIIFLLTIVALSLSTCLGISIGAQKKVDAGLEKANIADLTVFIRKSRLWDNALKEKVTKCNGVKKVITKDCIRVDHKNVTVNKKSVDGSVFLSKNEPEKHKYRLFNQEGSALSEEKMTNPRKGEIYLPVAFMEQCNSKIGDYFTIVYQKKKINLKIVKFFQEPLTGFSMLGIKQCLISDEDFQSLSEYNNEIIGCYPLVEIYAQKDYQKYPEKLKKEINNKTTLIQESYYTFSKKQAANYTMMFADIVNGILVAFGILLLIVTLIVIGNTINNSVESEYKNFGILKTQGFQSDQISLSIIVEYLLAGFIGSVIGILLSKFAIQLISRIYIPIMGVVIGGKLYIEVIVPIMILILLLIAGYSYIKTRKIHKISPVQAIVNGMPPIHFKKHGDFFITNRKKMNLTCLLAWKEIMCGIRYFISTIVIMAMLVLFMTAVLSVEQLCYQENVVDIFGGYLSHIEITYNDDGENYIEDAEKIIDKNCGMKQRFHIINTYLHINGEEILCTVGDNLSPVQNTLEGRKPKKDNEIMLTEMAANYYHVKLGDQIVLKGDKKRTVTIVGLYQSTTDAGMCATITYDCIKKIKPEFEFNNIEYTVAKTDRVAKTVEQMKKKYEHLGDKFQVINGIKRDKETSKSLIDTMELITVITFTVAVVFAIVISMMICGKTFRRDIRDLGIYKSLGYGTNRLRIKFTVKYGMVVFIGIIFGILCSVALNNTIVSMAFSTIGVTRFQTDYNLKLIVFPGMFLLVTAILFAWFVSARMKKVSAKKLIME